LQPPKGTFGCRRVARSSPTLSLRRLHRSHRRSCRPHFGANGRSAFGSARPVGASPADRRRRTPRGCGSGREGPSGSARPDWDREGSKPRKDRAFVTGNGGVTLRTRTRSKASKPTAPSDLRERRHRQRWRRETQGSDDRIRDGIFGSRRGSPTTAVFGRMGSGVPPDARCRFGSTGQRASVRQRFGAARQTATEAAKAAEVSGTWNGRGEAGDGDVVRLRTRGILRGEEHRGNRTCDPPSRASANGWPVSRKARETR
jgi:hypothetical protein